MSVSYTHLQPVQQHILVIVIAGVSLPGEEFVGYVPPAQQQPGIVHQEELLMIAGIQSLGTADIDGIVKLDLHVGM